ncbi:amidoligase family protein [Paenibacillus thermotolerans]|uniref:amidoligase family protein n=1 Tax=Paenibacillus thermotolerans TaxID=3027807 RepID=UPI00236767FE|nr:MULTISPECIES: amidoligase family protein [unclassified Paenibacillus]
MYPSKVDWKTLTFGLEIEFVGGKPREVELLPGWVMALDEKQIDETGEESGSELKPPPIRWKDREQIGVMLERLKATGAAANWSCGLHVHVGLQPWRQHMLLPLIDAALEHQDSIRALMNTSEERLIYCPGVTPEMRQRFIADPSEEALLNRGRPQSHRCGINAAAWFNIGTAEFRFANGSLCYTEILNVIEFYLRFVAAVGEGRKLSGGPSALAAELGAPAEGYPRPVLAPRWYKERVWLEEALIPVLSPLAAKYVPNGEILQVLPVREGIRLTVENPEDGSFIRFIVKPASEGWEKVG